MDKKFFVYLSAILLVSMISVDCVARRYPQSSREEANLQSLIKITDNAELKFYNPFGGDNGRNLFFAVSERRNRSNIYFKENPVSAAMSPKTDGRNAYKYPSFCSSKNLLVYSGYQDGADVNDIFMMDVSRATSIRRLTNTPNEAEFHPCISADGTTIVYERCRDERDFENAQIWCQDLKTESQTLLCQGHSPSFSHDGKYIVFVRFTPDGNNTSLVIMNTNGKNQVELTDAKLGMVEMPRFSPNDRQIVFQCQQKDKDDYDIYVINRDGTGLTQLTFNESYDGEPYWSNDGYIYFASDRGGGRNDFQIWRFKYGEALSSGGTKSYVSSSSGVYHTVSAGETITDIARKYGVTARDIVKWNNLTTMTLTPGMRIMVSEQ